MYVCVQMDRNRSRLLVLAVVAALISLGLSQDPTFPHIRLLRTRNNSTTQYILRNNSIINTSRLRLSAEIQCVTDLNTCCSEAEGVAGRAWYLPNGTRLSQDGGHEISSFQAQAGAQHFSLVLRNLSARSNPALSGVYECAIDTYSGRRQSVFVGLYYRSMAGENHSLIHNLYCCYKTHNFLFKVTCNTDASLNN